MNPEELSRKIAVIINNAVEAGKISLPQVRQIMVERPKSREHGDWATNVALQLAKEAGMAPRDLAWLIAEELEKEEGVSKVSIAGPGFINIVLNAAAAEAIIPAIIEAGNEYGANDSMTGHKINMEFVSANPTGPLHVGHGRWAALGDSIVRILRASGADVTSEYYVNDAGRQMDVFAESVAARIYDKPIPDNGYPGAYIKDLARTVLRKHPDIAELNEMSALPVVRQAAYESQLQDIRETLADFNVSFDVYFSEMQLHTGKKIDEAIDRLRAQGHIYEKDGAVWLSTTAFGDDKDRVLIRDNGEPTYFAADAAYYLSKKDRGFTEKIYFLGADHHGYVGRLKAIAAAAGDDAHENIELLIGQLVTINGAKLSKRAGNIVELKDIIAWLGTDAVRYTLERYPATSPLILDPELLRKRTNDNPVFYVQYAHARTRAVACNARAAGITVLSSDGVFCEVGLLSDTTETNLIAELTRYPASVVSAAQLREPHRIARQLEVIAGAYHSWYDSCRVIPPVDEPITSKNRMRLGLNNATGQVLKNGLELLGVSAPERM